MVFTLHRYIFRDIIKKFLITTAVLSTVMGLGVMLRPLREFSIDPLRVPELILCTLPMTLTMVMPIAALLATTLTYGRLAVDNEINACRSSGIGLMTLVYPGLTLSLLVGMASLLLVFHVIPSYAKRFEEIIQADAESIIYRNIEKRGNLGNLLPRVRLYADDADAANHRLKGVVAVRFSKSGIEQIVTAREVMVKMIPGEDENQIMLRFIDAAIVDDAAEYTSQEQTLWVTIPSFWHDDVKFKKLADLQAIREDMSLFKPVRELVDTYHRHLMAERVFEHYNNQLTRDGTIVFDYHRHPLVLEAEKLNVRDRKIRSQGNKSQWSRTAHLTASESKGLGVTLYRDSAGRERDKVYLAENGRLRLDFPQQTPQLVLLLEAVQWYYGSDADDQANIHYLQAYSFPNLAVPAEVTEGVCDVRLEQILEQGPTLGISAPSETLNQLYQQLKTMTDEIQIEIAMELHSRLAFGVSCVVLVLLGVAMGIVFKSGHLLTAFAISCIPAALCLITIFTGKHIAEKSSSGPLIGICFLWSGIVIAAVVNLAVYRRLLKQ